MKRCLPMYFCGPSKAPKNQAKKPLDPKSPLFEKKRKELDKIAKDLNIQTYEDWFKITARELKKKTKLSTYSTLINSLSTYYPQFFWNPLLFHQVPKNYWEDTKNLRHLFDGIAEELGITTHDDWYSRWAGEVKQRARGAVCKFSSVLNCIKNVYPEFEWVPFRFSVLPVKYWDNFNNQVNCVKWMEAQLGIHKPEEWASISRSSVLELGGRSLLTRYHGSLRNLLNTIYPNLRLGWTPSSRQKFTTDMLRRLVSQEDIITNYHMKVEDGRTLELDIYIPSLSLAFEYQGEHHYFPETRGAASTLESLNNRRLQKLALCKENGITLIEIPFWWNSSSHSLISTLTQHQRHIYMNN